MKRGIFGGVLALALTAVAVDVDGIVAIVGTTEILRSEVAAEMMAAGADQSRFVEFRNRLIDRQLILKAAVDSKMTMQEWVVDSRVKEMVDRVFGGDRNRLVEMLAARRQSYADWYRRIKEDMIVGAMRWNMIDRKVATPPALMKKYYAEHKDKYNVARKVSVSVILLKPESKAERDKISDELKVKDFAEVAKAHSVDSHAADGGLWKEVIPEEVFRPEICEEIAKMPVGTVSRWIELDDWSFLLRKESEQLGKTREFAEAYEDIEADVREAEAKRLYDEWLTRLRAANYIKVF